MSENINIVLLTDLEDSFNIQLPSTVDEIMIVKL